MIVLGFDTSTPATALALRLPDGATVQARDDPAPGERPGHATRLLPLAANLLAQAGLRFADIDRIAVGVGPGTFTGLRIGLASARALAQSLDAELVGVSSLHALAHATANSAQCASIGAVLALIDARRGEAFAAAYALVEQPLAERERAVARELTTPRALAPARFEEILHEATSNGDGLPDWVAVGNGAVIYRDVLRALAVDVPVDDSPLHRVSGEAICTLASVGAPQELDMVLPDYRRRPDAELALEHAAATGAATGAGAGAGA